MITSTNNHFRSRQPMPRRCSSSWSPSNVVSNLGQGDQLSAGRIQVASRFTMFGNGPPDLLFRFLAAESNLPE